MRYPVTLTATLSSLLMAWCACALALDPTLDVSQYAHDAWRVQEDGFTRSRLTSIAQTPDGYLWLGTDFGLYRFDGARNILWEPPPGQQLPSMMIWSLLAAHDGTLWIGTDKGLASWKGGKLTHFEELTRFYIFTILEDHGGTVWVGGIGNPMGTLCAIQAGSVHCFGEDASFATGVLGLYEDKPGNLWVGVVNGFWRWKPDPSKFYPMPNELNSIRAFVEDVDGGLLFNARSGIRRFMNGNIESYSLPGNLQQPRVMRMLRDRDGGLWLGTWNRGIIHVHRGRTDVYPDGLTGVDVVALLEDREGDIWAVTSTGLDRFREPAVETRPPPVLIEHVTADSKIYDASNGLRLPVHVRDLAIDYTAVTLVAPDKIHFRYKLEGQDPNWIEVVNDRHVQYTNLSPGEYHFRVTACNSSGVWNDAGTSLDFSIAPAYYQTTWFRLLCVAVFGGLIWALYQLRRQQVQRQFAAGLEERFNERMRIARELHDTLLQTIQGSKLFADNALDLSTDPARMRQSMERLSVWLRRATDEGRAALNSLRSSTQQRNDLGDALQHALEDCRLHNPVATSFFVVGNAEEIHPIVRDEIYRISYEAIRNACTHSKGTRVEVVINYAEDFTLRVRDDGVGIDPALLEKGKQGHFGLQGMRERSTRIGSKLTVVSSSNSGTEITVVVPGRIVFRKASESRTERIKNIFRRSAPTSNFK